MLADVDGPLWALRGSSMGPKRLAVDQIWPNICSTNICSSVCFAKQSPDEQFVGRNLLSKADQVSPRRSPARSRNKISTNLSKQRTWTICTYSVFGFSSRARPNCFGQDHKAQRHAKPREPPTDKAVQPPDESVCEQRRHWTVAFQSAAPRGADAQIMCVLSCWGFCFFLLAMPVPLVAKDAR